MSWREGGVGQRYVVLSEEGAAIEQQSKVMIGLITIRMAGVVEGSGVGEVHGESILGGTTTRGPFNMAS